MTACECNEKGSTGTKCEENGVCACISDFIDGDKCIKCIPKYFGFPDCKGK